MLHRATVASLLVLSLWLGPHVERAAAQSAAIQYAYDELGRLVAVVDQAGNAAIYVYDAVGNLLSIQRVDAAALPAPVAITAVVPERGKTGTVVSILGKGFGVATGQNAVAFNGVGAPVTQASGNRLITRVPPGATTGPVTVTAPLGSAVSPRPFLVIGALTVTPAAASLGAGGAQPFVATDGGADTTNVVWAVDGLVGGDAQAGTISGQGLYVAPMAVASERTVHVTATSKDDTSVVATAVVTLRPPIPLFLAAVSVGLHVTDPGPRAFVAPGVGVQRAPEGNGLTIVAVPIGVSPVTSQAFSGAAHVSVSRQPAADANVSTTVP